MRKRGTWRKAPTEFEETQKQIAWLTHDQVLISNQHERMKYRLRTAVALRIESNRK